jgi:hypothetical protein
MLNLPYQFRHKVPLNFQPICPILAEDLQRDRPVAGRNRLRRSRLLCV